MSTDPAELLAQLVEARTDLHQERCARAEATAAHRRRVEALEHDLTSARRATGRAYWQGIQTGRAYERRQIEQARLCAQRQPRPLGGGLYVVLDGYAHDPAPDDYAQAAPAEVA